MEHGNKGVHLLLYYQRSLSSITDYSPVAQVVTGLFPFLPITVRLILKIGKPIKNQVKGTVRMQSLLSSEID